MGISLLTELKKVKDKFFLEVLAKLTNDTSKVSLYLIYNIFNLLMTWGTLLIIFFISLYTTLNITELF